MFKNINHKKVQKKYWARKNNPKVPLDDTFWFLG